MIVCRTLGPIELTIDGGAAPPQLLWRKYFALLIYLARSPRRGRARDHLLGVLWPDKPEERARHSLNDAISALRRYLGEQAVDTSAGQVRLAAGAVRLDVDELAERAAEGDWSGAARLISGDFLEGFLLPGTSAFEDWLASERELWRGRSVEALVHRAEELLAGGDAAGAVGTARRALALEPRSEIAVRAAMRALALGGDRSAALRVYEDFAGRLRAGIDAHPDAETEALAVRIRRRTGGRDSPSLGAGAREPSTRPPLLGREGELRALLDEAAAAARERRPVVLVVEGESGLGKTRLLEELLARLRLHGTAVSATRAVEADRGEPWSGVFALARGGLLEASGLAAAPAEALAVFAGRLPEWADRFAAAGPAAEATPGRALCEVLRAVAEEQPVFLALDDAQWVDRESLLALVAALRDLERAPLGVVLCLTPRAERPELDELRSRIGRDLQGCTLSLGPLGPVPLREMARRALPGFGEVELDRLVRRIGTDSAGVPLLAVEILRAVELGLDLQAISGAWPEPFRTLDQSLPSDLPDAAVAAIRIGFGRLSRDAQRVLTAVAVLGDRVAAAEIERVLEIPGADVVRALDELEWERWLESEPRGYGFVARIVREVVARDMLTPGQRRRLLAAREA